MKKIQLYILIVVILFINILFIYEIANVGNGDIFGGLSVTVISLLIPILVYSGVRVVKWIDILGFSFMAVVTTLGGFESGEYIFPHQSLDSVLSDYYTMGLRPIDN